MNKSQFFYQRIEMLPPLEGQTEVRKKEYLDSFNISLVIRSIQLEDNRRLILLNDIHERLQQIPQYNKKNEQVGTAKERNTFQSEIYLEPFDSEIFRKLFIE